MIRRINQPQLLGETQNILVFVISAAMQHKGEGF